MGERQRKWRWADGVAAKDGMMGAMSGRDDDTRTARQIARGKRRNVGDRSARLANTLMRLSPSAVKKLALDEELRDAVDRARAVTSNVARRRAERTLAGELRRIDMGELASQLAKIDESGNADTADFHLAEQWRTRLIEEGMAAAAEFPGEIDDELPRLIDAARRERMTGRPPGAARALFRYVVTALKAQRERAAQELEGAEEDGDEGDDEGHAEA